jgi:type II secretory pathway pseudopilin PulG
MKKSPYLRGYTLLELSLVLGMLVGLTAIGAFGLKYFTTVARSNRAEAILRQVENARLSYLVDNPVENHTTVTPDKISPYLPGGWDGAVQMLAINGYTLDASDLTGLDIGYGFVEKPSGTAGFDASGLPQMVKGFQCNRQCPDK